VSRALRIRQLATIESSFSRFEVQEGECIAGPAKGATLGLISPNGVSKPLGSCTYQFFQTVAPLVPQIDVLDVLKIQRDFRIVEQHRDNAQTFGLGNT